MFYVLGYIFGAMLMFWVGWKMIKTLNPFLVLIGFFLWIGVAGAFFVHIGYYFHLAYHYLAGFIQTLIEMIPFTK